MNTKLALAGALAFSICAGSSMAVAGSITQPGESLGLALGAALPEGVYLINVGDYGNDRAIDDSRADLFVEIPILAWSTPWTVFGGRLEVYGAVPAIALGVRPLAGGIGPSSLSYNAAFYNDALMVGLAWNLGNGFNFSNFVGAYFPVDNWIGQNFWTFNERAALTYINNGWTLTAHGVLGITGNSLSGGGGKVAPDYFNLDLTALHSFGKWDVGPVGFFSTNLSGTSNPSYKRQSQAAVGGLVGYNFGPVNIQVYATSDVYTENYYNLNGTKAYEHRLFTHLIVPIWNPAAPATTVAAKY